MELAGTRLEVTYRIKSKGRGPVSVTLNGVDVDFIREPNPYRPGAARIPIPAIAGRLTGTGDQLVIWLD
jgi:1,2-beta-oligoglucan phosphorylase